jgi:hypothetical protein
MNLYRAWNAPAGALLKANFLFFLPNPFGRPLAEAWYRIIYHFAGFRPAPFHAALVVVLFVNLYLTYAVARGLSGSREVAMIATLVGCYNPRMASLYFDTGYVYDVLCYCFYFGAFLVYIRVRQQNRYLKRWELALFVLLYCLALSSKEMAITLPLFLLIYEWLYHAPKRRQSAPILVTGLVTAVFVIGKCLGVDTLLGNPAYKPHFTLAQFLLTNSNYLRSNWIFPLWTAMFLVAWLRKSRPLKFAWFLIVFGPLPVAFILPRGPAQYYIPWFGWTLYGAEALVGLSRAGMELLQVDGYRAQSARAAILMVGLAVALYLPFKRAGWKVVPVERIEAPVNAMIARDLHRLYPVLPANSSILFLNDPLPADWWNMMFLVRLSYRDLSLTVDCAKRIGRPDDTKIASYTHVFDYAGGRFLELRAPWQRAPMPMVALNFDGPEFFHDNWEPVMPAYPAEPGERIIAKAVDLGDTADVHVLIDGAPAPVELKIDWPQEANTYRVDFRVPVDLKAGSAAVKISANGAMGFPVKLPVNRPAPSSGGPPAGFATTVL